MFATRFTTAALALGLFAGVANAQQFSPIQPGYSDTASPSVGQCRSGSCGINGDCGNRNDVNWDRNNLNWQYLAQPQLGRLPGTISPQFWNSQPQSSAPGANPYFPSGARAPYQQPYYGAQRYNAPGTQNNVASPFSIPRSYGNDRNRDLNRYRDLLPNSVPQSEPLFTHISNFQFPQLTPSVPNQDGWVLH